MYESKHKLQTDSLAIMPDWWRWWLQLLVLIGIHRTTMLSCGPSKLMRVHRLHLFIHFHKRNGVRTCVEQHALALTFLRKQQAPCHAKPAQICLAPSYEKNSQNKTDVDYNGSNPSLRHQRT